MVACVLILSVFFQGLAAVFALRLIGPSRGRTAWVLISAACAVRAFRLAFQFVLYKSEVNYQLVLADEIIGLVISILLAAGVYWIGPLFRAFQQGEEDRELYSHAVSHDLRGPLTVIQGYAEYLSKHLKTSDLDEESRLGIDAIRHSSARMSALVQDLVDAARSKGQAIELNRTLIDLHDFLNNILEHSLLGADRARLHIEIAPGVPPVDADPERLERILINLISNALKYSPPGTPVHLGAAPLERFVILSVRDAGPGIDPRDLPRLFERYFRAKDTRDREGVGLGLYISRILVEAHGGKIWAESRQGEGCTFHFTLPVRAEGAGGVDAKGFLARTSAAE